MQKDGLFQKIIQIMVQMDFQLYISAVLHLWKMFCIIFNYYLFDILFPPVINFILFYFMKKKLSKNKLLII